jgi:hypothetical protein
VATSASHSRSSAADKPTAAVRGPQGDAATGTGWLRCGGGRSGLPRSWSARALATALGAGAVGGPGSAASVGTGSTGSIARGVTPVSTSTTRARTSPSIRSRSDDAGNCSIRASSSLKRRSRCSLLTTFHPQSVDRHRREVWPRRRSVPLRYVSADEGAGVRRPGMAARPARPFRDPLLACEIEAAALLACRGHTA